MPLGHRLTLACEAALPDPSGSLMARPRARRRAAFLICSLLALPLPEVSGSPSSRRCSALLIAVHSCKAERIECPHPFLGLVCVTSNTPRVAYQTCGQVTKNDARMWLSPKHDPTKIEVLAGPKPAYGNALSARAEPLLPRATHLRRAGRTRRSGRAGVSVVGWAAAELPPVARTVLLRPPAEPDVTVSGHPALQHFISVTCAQAVRHGCVRWQLAHTTRDFRCRLSI